MVILTLILNSILGVVLSAVIFRIHNKWRKSLHREVVDKTEMEMILVIAGIFGLPVTTLVLIFCTFVYLTSALNAGSLTAWARAKDIEEEDKPRFEQLLKENRRLKDELANKRLLGL